jgi:hypothetical protein
MKITLIPGNAVLPASDQRALNQVGELRDALKQKKDIEWTREIVPSAGKKGGAEAIIIALGSSGAIAAAVTVFKAWLARSGDRYLKVSGNINGTPVEVEITAKNVEEETIRLGLAKATGK